MKILVVDDSKAMRMIVIRTFRQLGQGGHEFVEADNGADGLAKLQSEQPDLVISDWNMPQMSGIEFLESARAEGIDTTFGFITSETATEFRERAIAGGAAFMLAKPFDADALQEALGAVRVIGVIVVAHYPVPIQEDIRDLLGDLLGRGVAVDKTDALELADDEVGMIASYVTSEDEVGALCACDGAFAVLVGAALVMMPAAVAKEQLEAGELDEQHVEFTHEVVNILSRLLNTPRTPHLRLETLYSLPGELPGPVDSLRSQPEFRRDFVVAIDGYGEGRVSILVN